MFRRMTTNQMVNELVDDEYSSFSRNGAKALIEYLQNLEEEIGEMEFDKVAIRCDFSEYESVLEAVREMGPDAKDYVIAKFDGGVIVQNF